MKFTGVVLAGGKSTRMGQDKAQLIRLNQTMLEFTEQQLIAAGAEQVIVNGQFDSCQGIPDQHNELGPLAGIYAVLSEVNKGTWCLFCPVDLPFLSANALSVLVDKASTVNCAVHYQKQPLPILIQASEANLAILGSLLEQADSLSIRHFLSLINHKSEPLKPQHNWFNANSPEQWQQVLEKIS